MLMLPLPLAVSTVPVIRAVTGADALLMLMTADIRYPGPLAVTAAARATGSMTWLAPQPPTATAAPTTAHIDATSLLTAASLPAQAKGHAGWPRALVCRMRAGYRALMSVTDVRPLGVGEILDAGIKVYLRNARTLMGLAAAVTIPIQAIAAVVLLSIVSNSDQVPNTFRAFSSTASTTTSNSAATLGANAVLLVVELLGTWLTTAACVKAVSDLYLGQPTDFAASLRFAARRLLPYLAMQVLYLLGLMLAFIALIVPGIWLYAAWSVSVPALLIERLGPARALKRSQQLVKGRWAPTAGVLLVATVMTGLISGAFQALLVGAAFLPGTPPVLVGVAAVTLAGAVSAIIVTPFAATVWTILYYDLRVRREGYDVQMLAEQLGLPAASIQPAPSALVHVPGSAAQHLADLGLPVGPESVGRPGGPPFWPPPPGWRPS
jgi:hypothetical protein